MSKSHTDKRHVEIASESYVAYLLSRIGYDIFVQYGPDQPGYDLVVIKGDDHLRISVKGSTQDGWLIAPKKNEKTYAQTIDDKMGKYIDQKIVYALVIFQGKDVDIIAPKVYIASASDIAAALKNQSNGRGYGALKQKVVPNEWLFSSLRMQEIHKKLGV